MISRTNPIALVPSWWSWHIISCL